MKPLQFEQKASQRIYEDYMKRIKKATNILSKEDQQDLMMEFNSHIFEGLQSYTTGSEIDNLLDVLQKLGTPEEVLKPLVAEKKLEQATRTFNPVHIFKALALNIFNGITYVIFALLYLFLFSFVFLIFAELWNPSEVGLFMKDGQLLALGKVDGTTAELQGATEVLGHWFIPIMLLLIVVFYILITLLLRLKRRNK